METPTPDTRVADGRPGALLVWHGYLLGGTGSNIYTRNVVEAWVAAGRDVVVMCQESDPSVLACTHEVHDVDGERVTLRQELVPGGTAARRELGLGTCTMVRSDLGGVLPVYVLDRYAGWDVVRFSEMDDVALEHWADRYRAALRGVLARHDIAAALLNHAVMGPPVLREVFHAAGVPYAVKVHGSELEYCIVDDPARFAPPALHGLRGAHRILVGSEHIARRTLELLAPAMDAGEEASLRERMEEIPPGVDLELFRPAGDVRAARDALVSVLADRADGSRGRTDVADVTLRHTLAAGGRPTLAAELFALHGSYEERHADPGAAARVREVAPGDGPTVAFVGKFIQQKGVHLFLAALPLVVQRVPDLRVLVAGFGPMREGLEAMVVALGTGDWPLLHALAAQGAGLDGTGEGELPALVRFLDRLDAEPAVRGAYLAAAEGLGDRIGWTGLVDHGVLARLWPLCTASVVPSILAEAFGMVAAEAAACGAIPVVSHHSGLATVAGEFERRAPSALAPLLTFDVHGATPVEDLAARLADICTLDPDVRASLAAACRRTVEEEWGWGAIAARVADACGAPVTA